MTNVSVFNFHAAGAKLSRGERIVFFYFHAEGATALDFTQQAQCFLFLAADAEFYRSERSVNLFNFSLRAPC